VCGFYRYGVKRDIGDIFQIKQTGKLRQPDKVNCCQVAEIVAEHSRKVILSLVKLEDY